MGPITTALRELMAAGLTGELLIAAVDRIESAQIVTPVRVTSADKSADRRREKDRVRQQIRRDNLRNPQTSADASSLLKEDSSKKEKDSRASRCPADWTPTANDFQFARDQGLLPAEIDREAGSFRDFWTAKPGKDGLKLDWSATWRNRIRNYLARRPTAPDVCPDTAWKLQKAMAETVARRNGR
jgi:hypothetical protein